MTAMSEEKNTMLFLRGDLRSVLAHCIQWYVLVSLVK